MEDCSYHHEGTHAQIDDPAAGNRLVSMYATALSRAQWQISVVKAVLYARLYIQNISEVHGWQTIGASCAKLLVV